VHLAQFPAPEEVFSEDPTPLINEWKQIFKIREGALADLELDRKEKKIGKSLEAEIEIRAEGEILDLLRSHADGLKEILNVSNVKVTEGPKLRDSASVVAVIVRPASGHKCARCWNFMPEVSDYGIWENVCTRCQAALTEMGIAPPTPAEAAQ
jgi:isoleucyl-tRNA synthetase